MEIYESDTKESQENSLVVYMSLTHAVTMGLL